MWIGVLFFLLVLAIGVAGVSFIPATWLTGWIVVIITILLGIVGLLLLFSLLRLLIRLSLGAAVSPAGDPPGKLIAITFAAIMVPSVPLYFWSVGTRLLQNLFGANPAYQGLIQLGQTACPESDGACLLRLINNASAVLLRFFGGILNDLAFARLPLLDLFWFVAAAVGSVVAVNLVRSAIDASGARPPLETLRNMVPETLRRRLPAIVLLIVAFYLGLSAILAIPVLRSGNDLGLSSAAVADDLLQPPAEVIERLKQLDRDLTEIAAEGAAPEPAKPELPPPSGGASGQGSMPPDAAVLRQQSTVGYVAVYDRQRGYLHALLDGAEVRFRQLATETKSRTSSAPRAFLGKRDKDRFIATVTDYYQTTISKYEIRLYNCRNALTELRERIVQYRASQGEALLFARLLSSSGVGPSTVDKATSDAVQVCSTANSPEQIEPKLPPDPFELLGPFGATVRWLVTTDSRAITTIIGMIGFGLLGATLSRIIRKTESDAGLTGLESFFVVAGGVTAAFVVFLGSYAMLGDQTSEPNPYVVFVTCLVGAVFSEDIWKWAREKFMPKNDDEKGNKSKAAEKNETETKQSKDGPGAAGPQSAEAAWQLFTHADRPVRGS
jgi:hypothetical protein